MVLKIILLLTITPLVELLLLVRIAEMTSFSFTILLVIATGIVGGILTKIEGLRVLSKIQYELNTGRLPGDSLLDGAMVLVAGALLLTPGVITDCLGFGLLFPPTRNLLKKMLKKKFKKMVADGSMHVHSNVEYRPLHDEPPPGSPPLENDIDESNEHNNEEGE